MARAFDREASQRTADALRRLGRNGYADSIPRVTSPEVTVDGPGEPLAPMSAGGQGTWCVEDLRGRRITVPTRSVPSFSVGDPLVEVEWAGSQENGPNWHNANVSLPGLGWARDGAYVLGSGHAVVALHGRVLALYTRSAG